MSFEQILGSCVAVIVAGMPAVLALLKIDHLHLLINSRFDKFISSTATAAADRLDAVVADRDVIRAQNTQLIDQISELAKQIDTLAQIVDRRIVSTATKPEKPPCTV
jgi:hypothetical protein